MREYLKNKINTRIIDLTTAIELMEDNVILCDNSNVESLDNAKYLLSINKKMLLFLTDDVPDILN